MQETKDPAIKERMQKMHERMNAMIANMQNMHSMMGNMMMGGGMMGGPQAGGMAPQSPGGASSEDHYAHPSAQ